MTSRLQRALVTGASGGVGRALCKLLVERGLSVVAVSRDPSRLAQVAGAGAGVLAARCDLAADGDVERLIAEWPRVDMLVNCAGSMSAGPQADRDWCALGSEIAVNATVVARLCHHYGAGMVAAGSGRIINFASTAAARPAPLLAAYAASKAFVLHLSQSLAAEWGTSGVRVTCCVPGPMATELAAQGGLVRRQGGSDPAQVARAALAASDRGHVLCFPDVEARLRYSAFRLAPPQLIARLAQARYRQEFR